MQARPGPVISGPPENGIAPSVPTEWQVVLSTDGGQLEDSGIFLRTQRDSSPDLPEVPASVLALVPVPLPPEDSGRLSVLACLYCPFVPALFTLLTSQLSLPLVASCFCSLPPQSLVVSVSSRLS